MEKNVIAEQKRKILDLTESPIERMLAENLIMLFHGSGIRMQPQKTIYTSEGNFRVDFLLIDTENDLKVVVECDGHEFHERTKEQVIRDNKRSRALMNDGYFVFRFSGSEIYDNPKACAKEIVRFVRKKDFEWKRKIEEKLTWNTNFFKGFAIGNKWYTNINTVMSKKQLWRIITSMHRLFSLYKERDWAIRDKNGNLVIALKEGDLLQLFDFHPKNEILANFNLLVKIGLIDEICVTTLKEEDWNDYKDKLDISFYTIPKYTVTLFDRAENILTDYKFYLEKGRKESRKKEEMNA